MKPNYFEGINELTESEKELFEERAAIQQFEGNLSKEDSEKAALNFIGSKRKEIRSNIFNAMHRHETEAGFYKGSFEYLTGSKRNLKPETISNKLFTISNPKKTIDFLRSHFTKEENNLCGLFSQKGFFIFTYHRIIIPYFENDKIQYLRGRYYYKGSSTPKDKFGKYIGLSNFYGGLNAKRLYNVDILKSLPANSNIYLSEGEFDCMVLNQNGFPSVAVPGITNFPKEIIPYLENFKINIVFDNDEAGQNAAYKIGSLFNKPVKIIRLKNYKDISEFAKCN